MENTNLACRLYGRFGAIAVALQPLIALAVRLYLFRVFFVSGLLKLRDCGSPRISSRANIMCRCCRRLSPP